MMLHRSKGFFSNKIIRVRIRQVQATKRARLQSSLQRKNVPTLGLYSTAAQPKCVLRRFITNSPAFGHAHRSRDQKNCRQRSEPTIAGRRSRSLCSDAHAPTRRQKKKKTAWPATPDPSLAAGPHLSCSSLLPPRGSHAAVWDVASEFSIEPSKLSVFANSFVVLVRLAFSRDRRNTQHTSASNGISQTNNRIFRGSIR